MGKEQEQPPEGIALTGIYFDIQAKMMVFMHDDRPLATVRLAPEGIIFDAGVLPVADASSNPEQPSSVDSRTAGEDREPEKQKPVTMQGKLKSKPRPGRPDARGNPTAWARFAAHEEDEESAHMYSATFHKHTVSLALSLDKNMPLTVQGFLHENENPGSKRMDTLSVINVLD